MGWKKDAKVIKTIQLEMPDEVDPIISLLPDLVELRNEALAQGDFKYAVHLSHVHKWLFVLSKALGEK